MDTTIQIKPLSVNKAWQGKRYKTNIYKSYEWALEGHLPKKIDIPEGKLFIKLTFGFTSAGSDWDNPIKPFVDILQKKYNFDDNRIYGGLVLKEITKNPFIQFEILPFTP